MAAKGKLLLPLIAVVGLACGGIGGFFASGWLAPAAKHEAGAEKHGSEEEEPDSEEEEHGSEDHGGGDSHGGEKQSGPNASQLGPFVVNLADPGARRYLRATLQLGLRKESYKKHFGTLDPRIRDALLLTLSSRQSDELLTLEGKMKLRQDIVTQINTIIGKEAVKEIYFVDFLIQ